MALYCCFKGFLLRFWRGISKESDMSHEVFMARCLELAAQGFGHVAPNPMVGAVIVRDGAILAEGCHRTYGERHAEADAICALPEGMDLSDTTLYVNLEPCSHHGKTPPCVDLILERKIGKVFIGALDPNPLVNGTGIQKLSENGIEVQSGVLEADCRDLNRRFYTFHEKKRPYIILKWAETADRFIARDDYSSKWVSSAASRHIVHEWRSHESAVMVGTSTAWYDNPSLIAHGHAGKNPVRIIIDREQRIPTSFHVFDESAKTILFNAIEDYSYPAADLIKIDFSQDIIPQIFDELHTRGIQSVLVEGGRVLVQGLIDQGRWDEARVFCAQKKFGSGIPSPVLPLSGGQLVPDGEGDMLFLARNPNR